MIRYSPSTGGFYDTALHAKIPEDAVEITAQAHRRVLAEQAKGATIVAHPRTGQPLTVRHAVASLEKRRDNARRRIRAQVDRRMGASPWAMVHALYRLVAEGKPLQAEHRAAFARLAELEAAAAKAERAMLRSKDPARFDAADAALWPSEKDPR